jgi:hypothetical protein
MPQSSSFTVKAIGGRLRVLQTQCRIAAAFDPAVQPLPTGSEFLAIWDTGATNSVVTQKAIDACGLKQIGLAQVSGVGGTTTEPTYLVSIQLPQGVGFNPVQVTRGILGHGSDVLIGMDIITMGDMVITNKNGTTIFSFCVPSIRQTDYVEEHNANLRQQQHFGGMGGGKKRPKKHKTFGKHK